MDITKLMWVLQNKALYFARADTLGDPFEGHYTRSKNLELAHLINQACKDTPPDSPEWKLKSDEVTQFFNDSLRTHSQWKLYHYVNCWHLNPHESGAMWKLYTSMNEAVCIKTTYKKLATCLPDNTFLGKVTYIDYDNDHIRPDNGFNFIMHKRNSYSHEQEVRAVFWIMQDVNSKYLPPAGKPKFGHNVDIDPKELIEEIYISPKAVPPLLDVVTKLIGNFGIVVPVKQSEVNAPPSY